MKLDVYVQDKHVGVLEQTGITEYVFAYLHNTPPELAVSLLMPVRTQSWVSPVLHPVFQISLPEGALRLSIEKNFAKNFDRFGDMEMLAVVGESLVGQVKVVEHGKPLGAKNIYESLSHLMGGNLDELIAYYLGDALDQSGVSGGFPKFLARSPIDDDGRGSTIMLDEWIIKLNGPDHEQIVLYEYFGMCVAQNMGLPTPQFQLGADMQRLLVRRFDKDKQGRALGFEDMCALTGLSAREKFDGSVESIVKAIRAYCPGVSGSQSVQRFYEQYLLACAIRNGDAHLKNFGLLYSPGGAPGLSPAYDMFSMSVYAPVNDDGDAKDTMALSLSGTKRWPRKRELDYLANLCQIAPRRQQQLQARLATALVTTAEQVHAFTHAEPQAGFARAGARMVQLWSLGIKEIDPSCAEKLHETFRKIHALAESEPVRSAQKPAKPRGKGIYTM
ncbi:type II toxin-antitoxin system HipA family toxin [Allopusillimonas ginsengisoli]|uniref:type II toxin-antitoxin system HipA family toxin n=1 Tax=Allopusillimonas ginsengisoli TaxID=453575 RepID=UPI0010C1B622|nr:type II toxin-antitoxin system HipA family toxin [Allopusillimonas ginsengisoli]